MPNGNTNARNTTPPTGELIVFITTVLMQVDRDGRLSQQPKPNQNKNGQWQIRNNRGKTKVIKHLSLLITLHTDNDSN